MICIERTCEQRRSPCAEPSSAGGSVAAQCSSIHGARNRKAFVGERMCHRMRAANFRAKRGNTRVKQVLCEALTPPSAEVKNVAAIIDHDCRYLHSGCHRPHWRKSLQNLPRFRGEIARKPAPSIDEELFLRPFILLSVHVWV